MKILNMKDVLFIGLLVLFMLLFLSQTSMAEDDWQYWSEYNFSYKIADRVSFILNPSIRVKDNISENQYWESRQGISYKFSDYLNINIHYLHSESKNSVHRWIDENTFEFQPTYKWNWEGFDLTNRFRLEYRIVNGVEKWRYRNQIKIGRKIKVCRQELIPFMSNEVFYDESVDQLNQNRARVGVSKKISKEVSVTVFYQYKANAIKQNWYGENILGTGVDLFF